MDIAGAPVAAGAAPSVSGVQATLPAPAAAPHPGPVVHAQAALPTPAAGPVVQAALPVPGASPLQGPAVQAALRAPATPEAAMNMLLQHPYQANLLQHLFQSGELYTIDDSDKSRDFLNAGLK